MTEAEAMERALTLAWRGWGRVHPNPMVGAVVLRGDAVVGEGWHADFGGPHAEVAALDAAGDAARGATLVVTLEPCRHHGKQPPCTDAIVRAGIRRVVAAISDPDPTAAGGAAALRRAGVEVALGPGAVVACRQNAAFRHRFTGSRRPWVALKLATSIDGGIADAAGRSRWVSGAEAREYAHWLRAGLQPVPVAVNVSARQCLNRDFVQVVRMTLRETHIPPRLLRVEITESTAMGDAEHVRGLLQDIRALGVGLSLDDFGTGHSSLAYLKNFPLHEL